MIQRFNIAFALLFVVVCHSSAQTTPQSQPNAPLELPDFLVTGKAVVDIAAGAKEVPSKMPTFSLQDLDSLNPTEKLPPPLAARRPLPLFSRSVNQVPGYVQASAGVYLTPSIEAGYSLRTGGYTLDLAGMAEHSNGWVNGSNYTTIQAGLNSSYVAPDKFLFFGKGLTETDFQVRHESYSLYADTASLRNRASTGLRAGVTTEAKVGDVSLLGAFAWSRLALTTSRQAGGPEESALDNSIRADVTASWSKQDNRSSARAGMQMQSLNGRSYSFFEAAYSSQWNSGPLTYGFGIGPQLAMTTADETRFGVRATAVGQVDLNEALTARMDLTTGMRSSSFAAFVSSNPYVQDSAIVDHAYDIFDVRASLMYQPVVATSVVMTLGARVSSRELVWVDGTAARFLPTFQSVNRLWLSIEAEHAVTSRDHILGDMRLVRATLDSGMSQTYTPGFEASVGYERQWLPSLRSILTLQYIGKRWVDVTNTTSLDGYLDLRIAVDYALNRSIDLQLRGENLVDSSVFLWNGYRARGIFVSLGLLWKM